MKAVPQEWIERAARALASCYEPDFEWDYLTEGLQRGYQADAKSVLTAAIGDVETRTEWRIVWPTPNGGTRPGSTWNEYPTWGRLVEGSYIESRTIIETPWRTEEETDG